MTTNSPRKSEKVMGSQYLLGSNDSPMTSRFEHAQQFEFQLETHKTFHAIHITFCGGSLRTVKMVNHVQIEQIDRFSHVYF